MTEKDDRQSLVTFVSRDMDFDEERLLEALTAEEWYEQLRKAIIARVTQLMDADFAFLLHILYRTDVNEERLKQALADNPDRPAEVITDAYLQRQLQKIETRRKYSKPTLPDLT